MEYIDTAAAETDDNGLKIDTSAEDALEQLFDNEDNVNYDSDFIDDSVDTAQEEYLPFNIGNSPSKIAIPCPPKKKIKIPEELKNVCGDETQENLDSQDIRDFSTDRLLNALYEQAIDLKSWHRIIKSDLTQLAVWFVAGYEERPHRKGNAILESLRSPYNVIRKGFFPDCFIICVQFKEAQRSRAGLKRTCSNVGLQCFIIEAPINRSPNVGYLVAKWLQPDVDGQKEMPWIEAVCMDPSEDKFDLSQMVQWALTHNYTNQAEITYRYSLCAGEGDNNAKRWLASCSQVKYAKDTAIQVMLFKKGQLMCTSVDAIIATQINKILKEKRGQFFLINRWLAFQKINVYEFLSAFKNIIHGVMKKSVLCLYGAPNSGKSTLINYFLEILEGKFITFSPNPSSFWLQPAIGLKMMGIDDVPVEFWRFADSNLRAAFDGTQMTVDIKFQAPVTTRLPPMLLTTNVDIPSDKNMMYLHNRVKFFKCDQSMLLNNRLKRLSFDIVDVAEWFFHHRKALGLEFELELEKDD